MNYLCSFFILGCSAVATVWLGACAAGQGGDIAGSGETAGSTTGSGSAGGAGGTASNGVGSSGGAGGGLNIGGGSGGDPEVCDGIDNDMNGIVDDLDVSGDGICDCLRIATLGKVGGWGTGDVFADWLSARSDNGSVDLADSVLTSQLLAQYQVIVVEDVSGIGRTYASSEVAALEAWVNAGGGLMTLIGYGWNEWANVNTLLAPFGTSYGMEQIFPKWLGATVPITEWVMHPTTEGVMTIGVDNGSPVLGNAQTLATREGKDLAKAKEVGQGHLFMWGDEWITYDSEWTQHPEYQVELFWLNVIKWLTPQTECQVPVPH